MTKQYVHKEGPDSAPEAAFQLEAFGVGVGVHADEDRVCEAVVLRQAVKLDGLGTFLVRSELPAQEARNIAARLVLMAQKVETREVVIDELAQ